MLLSSSSSQGHFDIPTKGTLVVSLIIPWQWRHMSELPIWPLSVCFFLNSVIIALTTFFTLIVDPCIFFLYAALSLAPLVVKVNPNVNVILTACLTVYVGCYRSVKPTPPSVSNCYYVYVSAFVLLWLVNHGANIFAIDIMQETMSKEHAMRFPLVGSAMLLSLFLLFKFLSKDLVNTVLTAYFFILGIVALS